LDCFTLEDVTARLPRNVGNQILTCVPATTQDSKDLYITVFSTRRHVVSYIGAKLDEVTSHDAATFTTVTTILRSRSL